MSVKLPFIRTPYNYDMMEASNEAGLDCGDEEVTIQSEKENCDINVIVARFGLGMQPMEAARPLSYGDFTNVVDFKTAMDAVASAAEAFEAFPAHVRAKFDNDPQKFLEFCETPERAKEWEEMGLGKIREVNSDGRPGKDVAGAAKASGGGAGKDAGSAGAGGKDG